MYPPWAEDAWDRTAGCEGLGQQPAFSVGLVTQSERHQTERPQLGALGREVAVGVPPLAVCWFFLRRRLKAKNLMYIKQILYLLEKFVTVLGGEHRPAWSPGLLSLPLGHLGFLCLRNCLGH